MSVDGAAASGQTRMVKVTRTEHTADLLTNLVLANAIQPLLKESGADLENGIVNLK